MARIISYRQLFNKCRLSDETYSESWHQTYILERGTASVFTWNYDAPGGSSSVEIYQFRQLYIVEDDSGQLYGPYKSETTARSAMGLPRLDRPTKRPRIGVETKPVEPPDTSPTKKNRQNQKTREFTELIGTMEFEKGDSHPWQGFETALRVKAIKQYVRKYMKTNNVFPRGAHQVPYKKKIIKVRFKNSYNSYTANLYFGKKES